MQHSPPSSFGSQAGALCRSERGAHGWCTRARPRVSAPSWLAGWLDMGAGWAAWGRLGRQAGQAGWPGPHGCCAGAGGAGSAALSAMGCCSSWYRWWPAGWGRLGATCSEGLHTSHLRAFAKPRAFRTATRVLEGPRLISPSKAVAAGTALAQPCKHQKQAVRHQGRVRCLRECNGRCLQVVGTG
jgi:hypothetical protein